MPAGLDGRRFVADGAHLSVPCTTVAPLDQETVVVTEVDALCRGDCLTASGTPSGRSGTRAVVPTAFTDSVLAVTGGSVALDVFYRGPPSVSHDVHGFRISGR